MNANSVDEAIQKVKVMYEQEIIVLDSNDFFDKEIKELVDE